MPKEEKYVLCRRDIAPNIGDPKQFCAKPINTPSAINWCDDHLKSLPWWPI